MILLDRLERLPGPKALSYCESSSVGRARGKYPWCSSLPRESGREVPRSNRGSRFEMNLSLRTKLVDRGHVTPCQEWQGALDPTGYGAVKVKGKKRGAHRVAWQSVNGSIPPGLMVLHRCDNRACVRPDHLFLGTSKDNMQDCRAKGRLFSQRRSRCTHGHLLSANNTYLKKQGLYWFRGCVKCRRDSWARDRARRAA